MGPIREGGGVAKWPSGSGTGFLLFILFNPGSSIDSCVALGKLFNISEFINPILNFGRNHNEMDFIGL